MLDNWYLYNYAKFFESRIHSARFIDSIRELSGQPTYMETWHLMWTDSHNTPGQRHNNTWVEPLAGNCTTVQNLLYTGSHGVVSIRHNFVCNHKRCRFLVFRNFAWGKINALKKNLSEKQFLNKYLKTSKRKAWYQLRSNYSLVTMLLSISSRTTSQYSAYNYMYSHFAGICYQRIHINKFVNNMTLRDQWPTTIHLS